MLTMLKTRDVRYVYLRDSIYYFQTSHRPTSSLNKLCLPECKQYNYLPPLKVSSVFQQLTF